MRSNLLKIFHVYYKLLSKYYVSLTCFPYELVAFVEISRPQRVVFCSSLLAVHLKIDKLLKPGSPWQQFWCWCVCREWGRGQWF